MGEVGEVRWRSGVPAIPGRNQPGGEPSFRGKK